MLTKQELQQKFAEGVRILDGATGSNLMKAGMPRGCCTEQCPENHCWPFGDTVKGFSFFIKNNRNKSTVWRAEKTRTQGNWQAGQCPPMGGRSAGMHGG